MGSKKLLPLDESVLRWRPKNSCEAFHQSSHRLPRLAIGILLRVCLGDMPLLLIVLYGGSEFGSMESIPASCVSCKFVKLLDVTNVLSGAITLGCMLSVQ